MPVICLTVGVFKPLAGHTLWEAFVIGYILDLLGVIWALTAFGIVYLYIQINSDDDTVFLNTGED